MLDLTNWLFAAHAWAVAVISLFIAQPRSRLSVESAGFPTCGLCGRSCVTGSPAPPAGRRECIGLCRPARGQWIAKRQ